MIVPLAPSLRAALVATLAAPLITAASGLAPAHAGLSDPPESGAGWLSLRTGLTFADAATLDSSVGLEGDGDPSMVLGVGVHWRTSRLDFGALFESLSAWSFPGISRDGRVGSQFRAAAQLRWRYIEDTWGAIYLGLTPGLTVMNHAAPLRVQAGQSVGADASTVDTHTLGFSFGFDFGVLFYLEEDLALSVHLDVITANTSLDTDRGEVGLDMVRGLFALGLEWRP